METIYWGISSPNKIVKYKADQFWDKLYVYKGYFPFLNNLATDSYGVLSHLKVQSICIKFQDRKCSSNVYTDKQCILL